MPIKLITNYDDVGQHNADMLNTALDTIPNQKEAKRVNVDKQPNENRIADSIKNQKSNEEGPGIKLNVNELAPKSNNKLDLNYKGDDDKPEHLGYKKSNADEPNPDTSQDDKKGKGWGDIWNDTKSQVKNTWNGMSDGQKWAAGGTAVGLGLIGAGTLASKLFGRKKKRYDD